GVGVGAVHVLGSRGAPAGPKSEELITPPDGRTFWPFSWSPSNVLAGITLTADGVVNGLTTYSFAAQQFHDVPNSLESGFQIPLWLGNGPKAIVRGGGGISIVNMDTGVRKTLVTVRGYALGRSVGVSRDGRWITYTETGTEGDIWLATFGTK